MAPSPEYDKEPKAPDKSTTNTPSDDSKVLHNLVNDQPTNSDPKPTNSTPNVDMENNKHVEALDDGQLRALLDEAITYKCPKDREGKSSLFKELLEEVEQDEQECEEAARTLSGTRGARRGARSRRALPHSNSLQDLVAALAADAPPRRHHVRHPQPQPAPSNVSARAIHGGSLPSGVDTSSLLSEEPARGAGYLATVRCVNPPPLVERRVSASDANAPTELEVNRRSKPMFPMTYTARATLEIGSGSVCSGRAVTTTTASNQVARRQPDRRRNGPCEGPRAPAPTDSQSKLMSALCPGRNDSARRTRGGGCETDQDRGTGKDADIDRGKVDAPRGPHLQRRAEPAPAATTTEKPSTSTTRYNINSQTKETHKQPTSSYSQTWVNNIDRWYEGLANYNTLFQAEPGERITPRVKNSSVDYYDEITANIKTNLNINNNIAEDECVYDLTNSICSLTQNLEHKSGTSIRSMPMKPNPGIGESHASHDKRYKLKDNSNRVNTKINCDKTKSDISIIREFHKKVKKNLVVPTLPSLNSTNFRSLPKEKPTEAIYKTNYFEEIKYKEKKLEYITETKGVEDKNDVCTKLSFDASDTELCEIVIDSNNISTDDINTEICKSDTSAKFNKLDEVPISLSTDFTELSHIPHISTSVNSDIELISITTPHELEECSSLSSKYFSDQKNLLNALEANEVLSSNKQLLETDNKKIIEESDKNDTRGSLEEICNSISDEKNEIRPSQTMAIEDNDNESEISKGVVQLNKNVDDKEAGDRFILAELPNNAYIFLTLPKRLLIPLNKDDKPAVQIQELENIKVTPSVPESTALLKSAKKHKEKSTLSSNNTKRNAVYRNALKVLLFENFLKGDKNEKSMSGKSGVSSYNNNNEVDSAIPFSCITTPEVVDSCNTTSSTSQAAVAIDPKPLQLGSSYCAVASVTGVAPQPRSRSPTPDRAANTQQPDGQRAHPHQPRSVISSSFNGLPLSRPNYGSTGTTAPDEFKKSLDENGNSVQGFSSPLSGSSQHKKPRRKKSSKNETVIDCRQIDGYQGDKDVNELLRFIESNPDNGRGHKLSRAKHRDDADEKGKKRPPERAHRKDKEAKVQRATSMEELSRTTIEELTAGAGPPPAPPLRPDKKERRDHAAVKAERRSWGDDGRAPFYYADAPAADTAAAIATELTDFQTVTKKRKPRRRADDNDRDAAPRRTRLPSPRARRESAPPSDRSNDSNDDMDSVHSLPADATPVGRDAPAPTAPRPSAPPAPHASYAEIARTRHNIPDLIESCNFYAEGENGGEQRRAPEPPAPVASDADGYPALEPRATTGAPPAEAGVARRPRDPKVAAAAAAAAGRRERKDRGVGGVGGGPAGAEAPAPDVVADRRPPVILLDSTVRPRDMDGVTFGFDINEQLLGAAARRPRCDLVRDAVEGAAGVAVRAGCAALRYLPPQPPPDTHHLHQIVDYVGGAWEDIVRCSGGKVRYFSE